MLRAFVLGKASGVGEDLLQGIVIEGKNLG